MKVFVPSQFKKEQPATGEQKDDGREANVAVGMNDNAAVWHLTLPNNGKFHFHMQDCVK